jgi:hypothetical protein
MQRVVFGRDDERGEARRIACLNRTAERAPKATERDSRATPAGDDDLVGTDSHGIERKAAPNGTGSEAPSPVQKLTRIRA